MQERLERLHNEFNGQVTSLQTELTDIKNIKEDLTRYIRELEQANDDLERAKRYCVYHSTKWRRIVFVLYWSFSSNFFLFFQQFIVQVITSLFVEISL